MKQLRICGESAHVQGEVVDSWKKRRLRIVQGYEKDNIRNIWNMDETHLFWHALRDQEFGQKNKSCEGGKRSKQRITIELCLSASGRKENLLSFSLVPSLFREKQSRQLSGAHVDLWMECRCSQLAIV